MADGAPGKGELKMYKGKKILAMIPARGGSKGLPRKNVKMLCGKPLVAWTIESALKSKYLDEVMVNTDDREIADISKKYGAGVPFLRPESLSGDAVSIYDVIMHTLDFFAKKGSSFDYFTLLEPTSPLRSDDDIDRSIKLLIDGKDKADSLVSLGEVHLENPVIMKKIVNGYMAPYIKSAKKVYRRQDMDKVFFPYGVIYLSKIDKLIKYRTFYQKKTIAHFVQRWQNYEIDDIFDFLCVEAVMKGRSKK